MKVTEESPMRLHIGTSGFAYREWAGSFYPAELREPQMLGFYAERFAAVEVNATFYRFPTAAGLAAWAAQVPERFRFALKVPRRISHLKRLRQVDEDLAYLFDTVGQLGPRLGALLCQLPPRMPVDLDALRAVTELVPAGVRLAFEFRDYRWLCEPVFELLSSCGCALCYDDALGQPLRPTADWGYVRLRRDAYTEVDLTATAAQLLAQPWKEAFVFVKHETPEAPLLALRLAAIAAADAGE